LFYGPISSHLVKWCGHANAFTCQWNVNPRRSEKPHQIELYQIHLAICGWILIYNREYRHIFVTDQIFKDSISCCF
jgi:hypothetical protein